MFTVLVVLFVLQFRLNSSCTSIGSNINMCTNILIYPSYIHVSQNKGSHVALKYKVKMYTFELQLSCELIYLVVLQ